MCPHIKFDVKGDLKMKKKKFIYGGTIKENRVGGELFPPANIIIGTYTICVTFHAAVEKKSIQVDYTIRTHGQEQYWEYFWHEIVVSSALSIFSFWGNIFK